MQSIDEVVHELRQECEEDYVGLWEVARLLQEFRLGVGSRGQTIAAVAAALLADPEITIGQFEDKVFQEWPGDTADRVERLKRELSNLGRAPDIGEVAWIAKR